MSKNPPLAGAHGAALSRRTLIGGAAWATPGIAAVIAVPAVSASSGIARGVVGGDMYHLGIWNMAAQVPIDSPFTLAYTGTEPVRAPSDFQVGADPASRWVGNDATATWTLPLDAGYRLSNIVVVFPWCGNPPGTVPVRDAYAAQWSDAAGRWLNADPRLLPYLVRPQEGHPEYATTLVARGTWGTNRALLPRTSFAANRPVLGTNSFTFTRADGVSTVATTDDSASIFTMTVPLSQLDPGESFSITYTALREVAFVAGNRYHGYGLPAFVIADYAPII